MTILWAQLLQKFAPILRNGISLNIRGRQTMIFLEISCMISDEVALKQALENKGAAGTIMCPCCQNVTDHKSRVAESDATGILVPSSCTDASLFRLRTAASIRDTVAYMQRCAATHTVAQFDRLAQSMGLNFRPGGLLSEPSGLGVKVFEGLMFDWMHVYLVSGIANVHTGPALAVLHKAGYDTPAINNWVNSFTWPARLAKAGCKDVLSKRGKIDEPVRCSASELLNLLMVLPLYVEARVWPTADAELKASLQSFLYLVSVLETLKGLPQLGTGAAEQSTTLMLQIKQHLNAFQTIFGLESWTPKFHSSLHLPMQLRHHKTLLSCFVQERKHKCIKRLGNQIDSAGPSFEKSILEDVLFQHMTSLETLHLTGRASLLDPKPAAAPLKRELQHAFAHEDILSSRVAVHGRGYSVSAQDVVVMTLEGERRVGRVHLFIQEQGRSWTGVSLWTQMSGCLFRMADEPIVLFPLDYIQDTLPYSPSNGMALVPLR
jgi:hypothetical protein